MKVVPFVITTLLHVDVIHSLNHIFFRHLHMKTKVCERHPMIDSAMGKLEGEGGDAQRGLVRAVDVRFGQ
jgi:hypothetical protein